MTTPRKKLIEVSIPLEAINKASAREKSIRHGHPSTLHLWWARRPLAACRAVLFAQLVDDPSAWPDRFPTPEAQDAERKRLHKVIEDMVPWEASNNETILNTARYEIARSFAWGLGEEPPPKQDPKAVLEFLQTKAPPVYDPFSGGGSIPLEAQRLGVRAYGSDLNPVAVLIGKALVEIPPKFAGLPPVNPNSRAEIAAGGKWNGKGAQGLAEDVRYYGQWMRDEAEKRIGHLYPKVKLTDGEDATVIAWLWARTVRSPDPAAKGAMVPLVSSFMLSTKEGKKAWVEVVIDEAAEDGWRFEVKTGVLSAAREKELKAGSVNRSGGGTCSLTNASMPFSYLRAQASAGGFSDRLMAVVAEGSRSRTYLTPTAFHEQTARVEPPEAPPGEISHWPGRTNVFEYGMKTFASLFTPRQLAALTTFSDLVAEAREKVLADSRTTDIIQEPTPLHQGGVGAMAYADALATYLGFLITQLANHSANVCGWNSANAQMRSVFARQAIPMVWDFAEVNPLSTSSGSFHSLFERMIKGYEGIPTGSFGQVDNLDAALSAPQARGRVFSTDPPYYDNIGYADLADFFYVWLRKTNSDVWPELFRRLATPKSEELVAKPHSQGGTVAAEAFFMVGMSKALEQIQSSSSNDFPITIYYAFKQSEIAADGLTSAGWAGFLQAITNSGLAIDGTWPIRTEKEGRMIGNDSNALASSIVLVCRKRSPDAATITRADFIRLLKKELPESIDKIRKAGVGPVDMQQSVIGPGMGVFSRYARVLEDDDSVMPVKTALALINRAWGEIENEADADYDPETQVALAWFGSYGFDARASGDLISMANAKNIPSEALFKSGVFANMSGKAALTERKDLPTNWQPSKDSSLTVWECVQHTARVLNAADGGGEAAAKLVAQMGSKGEAARTLAYRLFQIATNKGWASEALIYSELAQEWPRLEEIASKADGIQAMPTQGDLF